MAKNILIASVAIGFVMRPITSAEATTLTFDSLSSTPLPYTEDGVTFENVVPNSVLISNNDYLFFLGGDSSTYHVRATSVIPFDLISLDVSGVPLSITWRIESSTGGSKTFIVVGHTPYTLDLSGTPGFEGINSFDIIHDYHQERRALTVDNVVINFVPEPTSAALVVAPLLIFLTRRASRS